MKDKMQEAIEAVQRDVMNAAEQKLGRSLSVNERQGVERINSLMLLESCYRSLSNPAFTQTQVLAELEHFAHQK